MAEAWTPPEDGEGRGPVRPFDRQALQSTLADAVKLAADTATDAAADGEAAPPPRPATAPEPAAAARASNPFTPGAHPGAGAAAGRILPPLGGVGRPVAPTGPVDNASCPAPSLLSGGTGLGALRPDRPDTPSVNLGGLGGNGLGADRSASSLAPAPTERPTIPIRRPKPPAERAATPPEATPPPTPQSAPPQTPPRMAAPIPPWSPSDDDILPSGPGRRRAFRSRK